jgi:hypothetical protein
MSDDDYKSHASERGDVAAWAATTDQRLGAATIGTEVRAMTLTEFLLARLDEDEAVARDAMHPTDLYDSAAEAVYERAENEGAPLRGLRHFGRWSPTRVLAEVEAKRRIVEMHSTIADLDPTPPEVAGMQRALGKAVALLALPYADHPDFQEEWHA